MYDDVACVMSPSLEIYNEKVHVMTWHVVMMWHVVMTWHVR